MGVTSTVWATGIGNAPARQQIAQWLHWCSPAGNEVFSAASSWQPLMAWFMGVADTLAMEAGIDMSHASKATDANA